VFERTTTPMLLADDHRRYREANAAASELLGRPREQLRDLRVDDLVPEPARAGVPALWETFLADGSLDGTIVLLGAGGAQVEVGFSATANIVPGLHLAVLNRPERSDPVLDRSAAGEPGHAAGARLSAREREVLTLLALGASGADIAERLFLSPETVRTHTRRAREKLGARSRSHAITLAVRTGQIDP
jgi:DNA-binding CsgD family transcriptional regulator